MRPDNGRAVRLHLFRVSVNQNYSTFPTPSQFSSGQVFPNTAVDDAGSGTFPGNNAVWVDLDLVCGQCHGGGSEQINTTGSLSLSSPETVTVANGAGFLAGQKIMIAGAGAGGANLFSYIAAVSGNTITLIDAAVTAVNNVTVTMNPTQNNAPYKQTPYEAEDANNIHGVYPVPSFTWAQSDHTDTVSFNGSSTICPAGGVCVYSWAFGDGTVDNSNSIQINHNYTSAVPGVNSYSATLTVTNTNSSVIRPQSVTNTVTVNIPPTVNESSVTVSNMTVTLVDSSSAGSSITVTWGDGSAVATGNAGGTFTHTYTTANTYTIVHTATLQGLSASKDISVTVPLKFTVSGQVTNHAGAPLLQVGLSLQLNGVTKGITYTDINGNYSFINVLPNTYTISASKGGYNFASPAATVTVTNSNVTGVNFSSTN
jgi:hypothetical protein